MGPDGGVMGNLAVIDTRPMPEDPRALAIIEIFAARAAAEVSRLRVEAALRGREEQLHGLVSSALDAIVQLDADLGIVRANPAAEKTFGAPADSMAGKPFTAFLTGDSASRLRRYAGALGAAPPGRASTWVAGGLDALRADRSRFVAEASLASFEVGPS